MNAADWVQVATAVTTLALAGVTVWMAKETRKVAQQTGREADAVAAQLEVNAQQVDVAVAALRASTRPWLTRDNGGAGSRGPTRPGVRATEDRIDIRVPLRNVGTGLAVIPPNGIRMRPARGAVRAGGQADRGGFTDTAVIAPQGTTSLLVVIEPRIADLPWKDLDTLVGRRNSIQGEFFLDVSYTDADGGQLTRATVQVADTTGDDDWVIAGIDYYRGGEEQPFTQVKFREVPEDEVDVF